jgi:hypothetical protein
MTRRKRLAKITEQGNKRIKSDHGEIDNNRKGKARMDERGFFD